MNQIGDLEKRAEAVETAGKAQTPRDMNAKRASLEADGTVYEVDATRTGLVASAFRGAQRIWQTPLPAQDLFGLPFAVGAGVVLVAGSEHRADGRRALRLVALDATTGRIRFVRKHERRDFGLSTDVVIAGGTGVVVWADELLGYDVSSGRLSWSVGEAR
jgi:outer membrane protein assembly factor BamB